MTFFLIPIPAAILLEPSKSERPSRAAAGQSKPRLLARLDIALRARDRCAARNHARHNHEVPMNERSWQLRSRDGARLALGAAVALAIWPWIAGCGATTRADNDGTSARAGANHFVFVAGLDVVAGGVLITRTLE